MKRANVKVIKGKIYSVITGDIVASSQLPARMRRQLPQIMVSAGRITQKTFASCIPLEPAIFSGDGWQILISEPEYALQVALLYRSLIRSALTEFSLDTRLAIALGTVDFIPGKKITEADGDAFRKSGRALASMPQSQRMTLIAPAMDVSAEWELLFLSLDVIIREQWLPRRALAVSGMLRGFPRKQVEKIYRPAISQQALSKHLLGARWQETQRIIDGFRRRFADL